MIVDYTSTEWRFKRSKATSSFGVHISDDLSWSHHTDTASESSSTMYFLPADAKEGSFMVDLLSHVPLFSGV